MTRKRQTYLDPEAHLEAEKYANPIPSRACILQALGDYSGPAEQREIANILGISDTGQSYDALRRRLRAMERDGQILRTRRGAYGVVDKMDLIKGKVHGHRDGYGFVISDVADVDDLYLSPRQMRRVFDGDEVLAQALPAHRNDRYEGAIVEVLQRNTEHLVGRFVFESGIAMVIPSNRRLQHHIVILGLTEAQQQAYQQQMVLVQITRQPEAMQQPQGYIVECLGTQVDANVVEKTAIYDHRLPHQWPEEVLKEMATIPTEVTTEEASQRIDCRQFPFVTIDGADAKDFDDAVYAEVRKRGGWRLYVAIADVSHYVKVGSAIDQAARERCNSVYFPQSVIPMLPEALSNGICSLRPQVDRLCLMCEITISAAGKMTRYVFYEAIIRSQARLTYEEVGTFFSDNQQAESHSIPEFLQQPLTTLYQLYQALLVNRQQRHAIEFDAPEPYLNFDAQGELQDICARTRNDAHRLIEECMLCANVAAAKLAHKFELPILYRNHEPPPADELKKLRGFLGEMGLALGKGKGKPTPADYQQLLQQTKGRADAHLIQSVLLRSMSQACYQSKLLGHFGLNYPRYTHFTSPIRRYADLLLHRALRYLIRFEESCNQVQPVLNLPQLTKAKWLIDDAAHLSLLGEQCSVAERRAEEASRDVISWWKCYFMQDKVDLKFSGIVSGVTAFGLFVELENIYVEGLVHVSALPRDYYHFDAPSHRLIGERTRRVFSLGDAVQVKVNRVSLDERKIDFELVDSALKMSSAKHRNKKQRTNKDSAKRKRKK